MTTYRAIVLEHFRRPKNRGRLENANAESEGANPLCGDRIRVQAEVCDGVVREARFTADACALCIASASMLTEHVRGMTVEAAGAVGQEAIHRMLEGTPPPARTRCVTLPVETLRRALGEFMER